LRNFIFHRMGRQEIFNEILDLHRLKRDLYSLELDLHHFPLDHTLKVFECLGNAPGCRDHSHCFPGFCPVSTHETGTVPTKITVRRRFPILVTTGNHSTVHCVRWSTVCLPMYLLVKLGGRLDQDKPVGQDPVWSVFFQPKLVFLNVNVCTVRNYSYYGLPFLHS
jgi:hypothetical protein